MNIYIRQIKPMYYSPACQGFSDTYKPLIDEWYNEEEEEFLTEIYTSKVKAMDAWGSLKFEERYVKCNIDEINIREEDTLELTIDLDYIDLNTTEKIVKQIRQTFNNAIIVKFVGVDIEIKYNKEDKEG